VPQKGQIAAPFEVRSRVLRKATIPPLSEPCGESSDGDARERGAWLSLFRSNQGASEGADHDGVTHASSIGGLVRRRDLGVEVGVSVADIRNDGRWRLWRKRL
jgi:hypothetical protein